MAAEAAATSWIAVNTSGEICLDSDLPPLPRGWERCLDLQSGVMYLKQMNTHTGSDGIRAEKGTRRPNAHKRQRVALSDAEAGEGDPALQLTLSLPTSLQQIPTTSAASPPAQERAHTSTPPSNESSSLCDMNSLISTNGLKFLAEMPNTELDAENTLVTESTNGSSPPLQNASSSSSSSSSPSQSKQWGCTQSSSKGLRANYRLICQEKSVIRAAGCPHCFMYVLPSKSNPRCPRCKSSILVDLSPLTIH